MRSLAILFGTAFVLKHMLLASLYSPEGGWLKRIAGTLLQGVSLGTLDASSFAPATGYISFFTLTLYVAGLILLAFAGKDEIDLVVHQVIEEYRQLPATDQLACATQFWMIGQSLGLEWNAYLHLAMSNSPAYRQLPGLFR